MNLLMNLILKVWLLGFFFFGLLPLSMDVAEASAVANRPESPLIEIACKDARDRGVQFLVDKKSVGGPSGIAAGIAWTLEDGQIQSESGYLVHEELYKAYVLYLGEGRFVIEDNIFAAVGTKLYAKLSLEKFVLNLICEIEAN